MSKDKTKKPTTKEIVRRLEKAVIGLNNVFGLYVEYNEDMKGFQRFLKEKQNQQANASDKEKVEV